MENLSIYTSNLTAWAEVVNGYLQASLDSKGGINSVVSSSNLPANPVDGSTYIVTSESKILKYDKAKGSWNIILQVPDISPQIEYIRPLPNTDLVNLKNTPNPGQPINVFENGILLDPVDYRVIDSSIKFNFTFEPDERLQIIYYL